MADRLLYLARHGEAERGPEQSDGSQDGELTPRGIEQCEHLAQRLAAVPLTVIHHSTLARATQTAQIVAKEHPGIPMHPDDLLRECIPAVPEAQYLTPAQAAFFDSWADIPDALRDGPAQAAAALGVYATPTPEPAPTGGDGVVRELVISHGNLINWFVGHAVDAPPWAWLNLVDDCCALSAVLYRRGHVPRLLAYNDTGHLPPQLRGVGRPAAWRV